MRVIVVGRALAISGVHYRLGETFGVDDDLAETLIQGGRVEASALRSGSDIHTAAPATPPSHRQARVRRRVPSSKVKERHE